MSLKKIAAMTGVSVSTVSRVLNNTSSTCASKQLQDKIWKAAREIGYCPNEAARTLKKGGKAQEKFHIIIVMARVTADEDPFFAELLRCLEIELLQQEAAIDDVIHAGEHSQEDFTRANGIIILGRCSSALLKQISDKNKNIVGIWRNSMNFSIDEVLCDGKKAAKLAINHLLSLGHQKIAYIGDCSYESRYVGYCDILFQNNIPLDYELIQQTNQTRRETEAAFQKLMESRRTGKTDFSAIFCANDYTAIHVLELLSRQKPGIRNSISVISIDDIEDAQNTTPFLTTIRIPRREMAHMAVMVLMDRIQKGHTDALRIEFFGRLINRDSCRPVPRDGGNFLEY